jgi:hypothetical protein
LDVDLGVERADRARDDLVGVRQRRGDGARERPRREHPRRRRADHVELDLLARRHRRAALQRDPGLGRAVVADDDPGEAVVNPLPVSPGRGDDRDRGAVQETLGDAADEGAPDRAPVRRTDHDEVDLLVFGEVVQDLRGRASDVGAVGGAKGGEVLLGVGEEGLPGGRLVVAEQPIGDRHRTGIGQHVDQQHRRVAPGAQRPRQSDRVLRALAAVVTDQHVARPPVLALDLHHPLLVAVRCRGQLPDDRRGCHPWRPTWEKS